MNRDPADVDPAADGDPAAWPARTGYAWGLAGTALIGLLLAAYLTAVSLTQRGLPLGCGQGSGCDEVLRSRWSGVAGLPVSAVAIAAYAAALVCALLVCTGRSGLQRTAWFTLTALAGALVSAAVWFVGLQVIVLRAICPWCLAEHAVGLVLAGLVFLARRRMYRPSPALPADETGTSPATAPVPTTRGVALGVIATMILAAVQMLVGGAGSPVARLPAGRNADTGPGPDRQVAVLNGRLIVDVHAAPHIGDPDAPHVLVLLFDYCCPHCRATHGFLAEGLRRYPGQYAIVLLPTPLDSDCNPAVIETEPRFEEACDLARLALAVWTANREAYEEFDRWLFEPERPRTLVEARAQAETLIGPAALRAALSDPAIDARIAADVAAYAESGAQTIPVLLSSRMDSVVGRTETAEELFAILELELGLQMKASAHE
jgi:uncharacterized membrane protein/protein-disulfide isomerase